MPDIAPPPDTATGASLPDTAGPRLTVLGEAVIDLVPENDDGRYQARPGGSPFNVAVGLARLGHRVALMARLGENSFGRLLREHAASRGVDVTFAPDAAEPATLAVIQLDREARATYEFYLRGAADWQWSAAELTRIPDDTAVFHTGSLAAWTQPGADRIYDAAARLRRDGRVLISFDPNVRPELLGEPGRALPLVERLAAVAHVVKASRDDIEWLYPGKSLDQVARHWQDLGSRIVVITDGPRGAHVFPADGPSFRQPGRKVRVADTIGAGDAFTAGFLGGLVRRGVHAPEALRAQRPVGLSELLAEAADEAVLVSSVTCERVGADPPTAADLGWQN